MRRSHTENSTTRQRRRSWFQNSTIVNLFTGQQRSPSMSIQEDTQQQNKNNRHGSRHETNDYNCTRIHQNHFCRHSRQEQQQSYPQRHSRSRSLDVTTSDMSSHSEDSSSPPNSHHSPNRIVSIISKAKRHGLRRLPTASDLRQFHSKSPPRDAMPPVPTIPEAFSNKPKEKPLYLLSTGEEEADRIQLKNDLIKLAFEGEFTSPINFDHIKEGRVLDIGCGPGSWCIDLAQEFPHLHVIGVDNVNMFPDPSTIPVNCELIKHNVLDGFTPIQLPEASFDCIHIRFMCLAFTRDQYSKVINNCWHLLRPGGYLEILEMDMMVYSPGPATERLNLQVVETARSRGLKPRLAREITSLIPKNAVNCLEKYRSLPIGIWGGRLGVLMREDLSHVLTNSHAAVNEYNRGHGKPVEEPLIFQNQLEKALKELEQYHSYSNFHIIIAQKPNVENEASSLPLSS